MTDEINKCFYITHFVYLLKFFRYFTIMSMKKNNLVLVSKILWFKLGFNNCGILKCEAIL